MPRYSFVDIEQMAASKVDDGRMAIRKGYLGPLAVIQVLRAVETLHGTGARDQIMQEAALRRSPEWNEPVREEKVARLHQALRRRFPDEADAIAAQAGRATTDYLLDHRISKRAQQLLQNAPKAVAAWLLRQSQKQNARAFGGSGEFVFLSATVFELRNNPVLKGESAKAPVCHFHAAAFERMYQRLVDAQIICREIACKAAGAAACRFELSYAPAT
jgi:divinyl protochlorophyllide a 8-vinyl-reductase